MIFTKVEKSEWLIIALCFSLLFHASLLLIQAPEPQCVEVELVPVQAESGESSEEFEVNIINPEGDKPCTRSYWGIGIVHIQGIIISVAPGGPADKIGIQVRDIIVDDTDLKGDPFTNVIVKFIHNGKLVVKNTMREEICDN